MMTNKATQPIREEKMSLIAPHYYNTEQNITERINVFTSTHQEILVAWFPKTPNVVVRIVIYLSDLNEPTKSHGFSQ